MPTKDLRKLAHKLLVELKEEDVSEVIKTMRNMKNNKSNVDDNGFPIEKPTYEELEALKKAKKEISNGESYTHEEVFGEDDYV